MKNILIVALLLFNLLLFGCSVKYTANPATNIDKISKEVCIIEDTKINPDFLPLYRIALEKKGYIVRVLSTGSSITSCPVTSTYTGSWSWDFVMYMSYAEIVVYRSGTKVGDAVFEAPPAGWSLTPRIYDSTEIKITTMVDKLFPNAIRKE
jgi:hypothetical protein